MQPCITTAFIWDLGLKAIKTIWERGDDGGDAVTSSRRHDSFLIYSVFFIVKDSPPHQHTQEL